MKRLKLKRIKVFSLIALVGICTIVLAFRTDTHKISYQAYSGEELFRGIILMDGEIAKQIPIYENVLSFSTSHATLADKERIRRTNRRILEDIRIHHPGYFEQFKTNILSGDPVLVDKEIEESAKIMKPFNSNKASNSDYVGIPVTVFLPADVALAAEAFIVATLEPNISFAGENMQLKREQLVDQIVNIFY